MNLPWYASSRNRGWKLLVFRVVWRVPASFYEADDILKDADEDPVREVIARWSLSDRDIKREREK